MISIIIPIYNSGLYLENCLNSVTSQTYSDLEIILVNDASTDNSLEICNLFAKKDKRIRIISLDKNSGIANARNIGIDSSRGEYLFFIDSDDEIVPDAIKALYSILVNEDVDIACGAYNRIFEYKSPEYIGDKSCDFKILNKEESIDELLFGNNLASVHNKVFKKDLFNAIRMANIYYEDMEFIPRLVSKAKKVAFTNKVTYKWYFRKNSNSNCNLKEGWSNRLDAYYKNASFIKENYPKLYDKSICLLISTSLIFLYQSMDIKNNYVERKKVADATLNLYKTLNNNVLNNNEKTKIYCLNIGLWFFDICHKIKKTIK